jgi:hypothetical protein
MSHTLLTDPRLFQFLQKIDADTVAASHTQPCQRCGAALDRADFPRKPRGLPAALEASFSRRPSLCCRADGCRRRQTPVLLAFLGRRVYVSVAVVLVAAMRQGPSPSRLHKLKELLGISRQTVDRWLAWWRSVFPMTAAWRRASGALVPNIDETELPSSLLVRLAPFDAAGLGGLLLALPMIIG